MLSPSSYPADTLATTVQKNKTAVSVGKREAFPVHRYGSRQREAEAFVALTHPSSPINVPGT